MGNSVGGRSTKNGANLWTMTMTLDHPYCCQNRPVDVRDNMFCMTVAIA